MEQRERLEGQEDTIDAGGLEDRAIPDSPTESGVIITELATLPDKALLDERALAEALGVTKRTIRRQVGRYELPPPVKLAGRSEQLH